MHVVAHICTHTYNTHHETKQNLFFNTNNSGSLLPQSNVVCTLKYIVYMPHHPPTVDYLYMGACTWGLEVNLRCLSQHRPHCFAETTRSLTKGSLIQSGCLESQSQESTCLWSWDYMRAPYRGMHLTEGNSFMYVPGIRPHIYKASTLLIEPFP